MRAASELGDTACVPGREQMDGGHGPNTQDASSCYYCSKHFFPSVTGHIGRRRHRSREGERNGSNGERGERQMVLGIRQKEEEEEGMDLTRL